MKPRILLFVLLLAVIAYLAYEQGSGRDPLERVAGIFESDGARVVTAPAPAPAPVAVAADAAPASDDALVLSAPPRDNPEDGAKRFGPMADYLSQVLGRTVVYRHPGTWGGYQTDMQRNAIDLAFDGPHFVSWRIEKLNHYALVKLPGEFLYVGFVAKDNGQIQDIQQLAGQKVCVHAPPNLGTMMLLNAFDNTTRQPAIVITEGYDNIYKGVVEGKCVAGMLPQKHLLKHDKSDERMRVIYSHRPYPQQALTAGPRLSPDERAKLTAALTAPAAETALASFREAYAFGNAFVPASNEEYANLGVYLKTVPGFYKLAAAR